MNKEILRDISYGMYTVTTKENDKKVGCFVNTLVQITSDGIISVSLNKENYTNEVLKRTKEFSVSIISEDSPKEVIGNFGYKSSRDTDKFEGIAYEEIEGLPVVTDKVCGYIICDLINVVDAGTHDIFIGKIKKMDKLNDLTPMTYKYYHEVLKGKAPKTAPSYIEDKTEETPSSKYRCTVCGYIYDDAKEAIKFEDLPDTWTCPMCGMPKDVFEKIS